METILHSLNDEQRSSVESAASPLMIIAGPGTGKTKTLTTKIAYLMNEQHIPASKILALTFTRKASHEMQQRLQSVLPANSELPLICTFHALASTLLQDLGVNYELISEPNQSTLLKELHRSFSNVSTRDLSTKLSIARATVSPDESQRALVHAYTTLLNSQGVIDYDELLHQLYGTLRDDSVVCKNVSSRFSVILVDEFQDTNEIQYEIIRLLMSPITSLFVIGDPHQSIYSFRGANADIFTRLLSDYPSTQKIVLTTNYRSSPEIVTVSQRLMPNAQLQAATREPGSVLLTETWNEYSEADVVVSSISDLVGGTDLLNADGLKNDHRLTTFADVAVIYRTHRIKQILEDRMMGSGIPFQVIGSGTLYQEPSIQLLIDTIRYAHSPSEEHKLRLRQHPQFPSDQSVDLLVPQPDGRSLSAYIEHLIAVFELSRQTSARMQQQLKQFVASTIRFDASPDSFQAFVDYMDYLSEREFYDPEADKVTLLTMHAAKGLEFTHVFVIGCEEGMVPLIRDDESEARLEEERRLFYVAMTRAKRSLCLVHTRQRHKRVQQCSRFIAQLGDDPLQVVPDPQLASLERKRKRAEIKKSQLSLFG